MRIYRVPTGMPHGKRLEPLPPGSMSYAAQMLRIGVRQERDGRLLRIVQTRDIHKDDWVLWTEYWERNKYESRMPKRIAMIYLMKLGRGVIFEDRVAK